MPRHAGILGAEFDFTVADAITCGEVTIDSTPEEIVLGALPILSAALFLWFREHRPGPRTLPAVVLAAQATDLCRGGSFNLQDGLEGFLAAYATAYATDQAFNVDLVYNALARAISDSMSDPAALKCVVSRGHH